VADLKRRNRDFRTDFVRLARSLAGDKQTILDLVAHPSWTEIVNAVCGMASPEECESLVVLLGKFDRHFGDAAINSAAFFVVFGNGVPRCPGFIRHFSNLFARVIGFCNEGQLLAVPKVINMCLRRGDDEDIILEHIIPPFRAKLQEMRPATRIRPVFEVEPLKDYLERTEVRQAFPNVKEFAIDRMKANQRFQTDFESKLSPSSPVWGIIGRKLRKDSTSKS
jgi:hypothetical protein